MIKFLLKIVKRIIIAILILYGLNIITINMDVIIPINVTTILVVSSLGFSGLASIIALYFLI